MTDDGKAFAYGLEDRVPLPTLALSAIQHIAIIAPIGLVFPVLVSAAIPQTPGAREAMIGAALIALGIGSTLLCMRGRFLGTGFLAPSVFTAAYLPACLSAAALGGLPLVMGMIIFAGLCEIGFSFLLRRFRSFVPTEIAGLAVLMIGFTLGLLGFRLIFGLDARGALLVDVMHVETIVVGLGVLALTIVLNVWCTGGLRIYAVLIGVVVGYVASILLGLTDTPRLMAGVLVGPITLPNLPLVLPTFDLALVPQFAVSALAAALRAIGDITTCQKINDKDWARPEFGSIERGVRADGLATVISGSIGSLGLNTFSGSIGLSQATGITARSVGYAIGALFVALSCLPPVTAVAATIPLPVTGGILLFSSAFILANGLQIIVARLLDSRRIVTVGLALTFGISHDVFLAFYTGLPSWLGTLASSGLVVTLLIALVLNAVFRIGVARTRSFAAPIDAALFDAIQRFTDESGAAWGARRDVIQRVFTATIEAAEIAMSHTPGGRFAFSLTYDEFQIDAEARFSRGAKGAQATADAAARGEGDDLPMVLIRHYADQATFAVEGDEEVVRMAFEA